MLRGSKSYSLSSHLEQLSGQMMQQSMINVKGGMIKQMLGVKLTADQ